MDDDLNVTVPLRLLESLVDRGDCDLDHRGRCQAHTIEPDRLCPQAELKAALRGIHDAVARAERSAESILRSIPPDQRAEASRRLTRLAADLGIDL